MPVRQRGEVWQADVQHAGRRHRATFKNQPDAIRWEAEARIAIADGRPIPDASSAPGASATTEATLETIRDIMLNTPPKVGWKGLRSEKQIIYISACVVDYFGKNKRVSDITQEAIDKFIADMGRTGIANATINRRTTILSKMLKFARRRGWLKVQPLIDRQKESEGRIRWLTWDEQDKLVGAMRVEGQHQAADLTEFLADTGFRVGEAVALTFADTERGRVAVDPIHSKNGKGREVPQTERVKAIIAKRRTETGGDPKTRVFDLSRFTYRSIFDRARARAKLGADVVPHTLRHTCLSRLVQAGVDIRRVKEWAGHSSLTVTMRYSHLAPEHLYEVASVLDRDNQRPPLMMVPGRKSFA